MKDVKTEKVVEITRAIVATGARATTLGVKTIARVKFALHINQEDVSTIMNDLFLEGKIDGLTYHNNGTYREYYVRYPSTSDTKTIFKKASKTKTVKAPEKVNMQFVSRTKAVDIIQNSKGRFISVTFEKNNGETRTVAGRLVDKNKPLTKLGYLLFQSFSGIKNVNPRTIHQVRDNKVLYQVK